MSNRRLLKRLIELQELEELQSILTKGGKNTYRKRRYWWVNPVKLWLVLILLYPIVGPLYDKLIKVLQ